MESSNLRERKQDTPSVRDESNSQKKSQQIQTVEVYLTALIDANKSIIPASVLPFLTSFLIPAIIAIQQLIVASIPSLQQLYVRAVILNAQLAPYKLHLLLPSACGLILCFFGGSFVTLIAAVEAYRLGGYEVTLKCVQDIIRDFSIFWEENKKDDLRDDDNNGIPDVLEASSSQELITRKTLLFLRSVDPERFTNALAGINGSFLSVVATLKLQFVKAITLGRSIAEQLDPPAKKYVIPALGAMLPPGYKRWAKPIVVYSIHSFAISIAWIIQRVISAFHSAIRGGLMCSRNLLQYLSEMKIYEVDHDETLIDEVVGYALAFLGCSFQLLWGFRLPFPLSVLLFPFTLLEYWLMWIVSSKFVTINVPKWLLSVPKASCMILVKLPV